MNNKIYKCVHCGRNLGDKVSHRCKGTFRKKGLQFRNRISGQIEPLVIAKPPDILEKMKTAKNIKFFLKDKVLRIENKNIEDTEWLEEFGEEYFFKDGVDIIAQLYIWMKAGIKIEFKA